MESKDIQVGYRYIYCDEIVIAASCEADYNKEVKEYCPANCLIYTEQGTVNIKLDEDEKLYSFSAGSLCLIRKYTQMTFSKTFTPQEGYVKSCVFGLPDNFIRKIISDHEFDKALNPIADRVIELSPTSALLKIMNSIKSYVDEGQSLEPSVVEQKVKEALTAIINSNQTLAVIFKEYTLAERADLAQFMNHNFMLKRTLAELARLSGRSLSTFNREFKLIFNTSPYRWIRKKRLEFARQLLLNTNKKISEVYLEVGYEDFGHFSRSFTKEFGINPSKLKTR